MMKYSQNVYEPKNEPKHENLLFDKPEDLYPENVSRE